MTDLEVWLVPISYDALKAAPLHKWLDPTERSRAASLFKPEDRLLFVESHGWLRRILGHVAQLPPQDLRFGLHPEGKPFLQEACPAGKLRFSLSHCQGFAAVALTTTGCEVGVDIEPLRRSDSLENVARLVMTPSERSGMERLGSAQSRLELVRRWTAKEAYTKALGVGLLYGFETLRVDFAGNAHYEVTSEGRDEPTRLGSKFSLRSSALRVPPLGDFIVSAAILDHFCDLVIRVVDPDADPTDRVLLTSLGLIAPARPALARQA